MPSVHVKRPTYVNIVHMFYVYLRAKETRTVLVVRILKGNSNATKFLSSYLKETPKNI